MSKAPEGSLGLLFPHSKDWEIFVPKEMNSLSQSDTGEEQASWASLGLLPSHPLLTLHPPTALWPRDPPENALCISTLGLFGR